MSVDCQWQDQREEFLLDWLDEADAIRFREHMAGCAVCQHEVKAHRELSSFLAPPAIDVAPLCQQEQDELLAFVWSQVGVDEENELPALRPGSWWQTAANWLVGPGWLMAPVVAAACFLLFVSGESKPLLPNTTTQVSAKQAVSVSRQPKKATVKLPVPDTIELSLVLPSVQVESPQQRHIAFAPVEVPSIPTLAKRPIVRLLDDEMQLLYVPDVEAFLAVASMGRLRLEGVERSRASIFSIRWNQFVKSGEVSNVSQLIVRPRRLLRSL